MRSGSVLSSGCLPALLRPEILLCPHSLLSSGSLLRPDSLLSFGSLLRPGSLLGSGSLLCLRLQGISALRAEGLVIGYFSSTLRTKHKTPPHKQAPIRHYCRSGPLISLNQFEISSASAPAEPPIPAEPSSFSAKSPASAEQDSPIFVEPESPISEEPESPVSEGFCSPASILVPHFTQNFAPSSITSPQFTAAMFATAHRSHVCRASVRHIRLTSPRSHLPDSAQSPEPAFQSPDTAPQWRSPPPSSE